jgi:hypothetical protein
MALTRKTEREGLGEVWMDAELGGDNVGEASGLWDGGSVSGVKFCRWGSFVRIQLSGV